MMIVLLTEVMKRNFSCLVKVEPWWHGCKLNGSVMVDCLARVGNQAIGCNVGVTYFLV